MLLQGSAQSSLATARRNLTGLVGKLEPVEWQHLSSNIISNKPWNILQKYHENMMILDDISTSEYPISSNIKFGS
jgi:hypothetical protein